MKSRTRWWGALMVLPATIFILVFGILPVFYSFWMSLYDIGLASRTYVGFQNYVKLIQEPDLWDSIRVTSKFVVVFIFGEVVCSYVIALGLDRLNKTFAGIMLVAYRVPGLVAGIATIAVWRWIFRTHKGGLNLLLGRLHIPPVSWFGNVTTAPWACAFIIFTTLLTGHVLLYMAAMHQVNPEIIEASRLDGANELQIIWHIITPLTQPMRLYILLGSFISALQVWETPFFFTGGGPLGASTTVMYKIYQEGFLGGEMGIGLAMSVVMALFTVSLSIFFMKKLKVHLV